MPVNIGRRELIAALGGTLAGRTPPRAAPLGARRSRAASPSPGSRRALADGAHHAEAGCPRCARQRGTVGALISRASDAVPPCNLLRRFWRPTVTAPDRHQLRRRAFFPIPAATAARSICSTTHSKTSGGAARATARTPVPHRLAASLCCGCTLRRVRCSQLQGQRSHS